MTLTKKQKIDFLEFLANNLNEKCLNFLFDNDGNINNGSVFNEYVIDLYNSYSNNCLKCFELSGYYSKSKHAELFYY